jgi:hypothetical protein
VPAFASSAITWLPGVATNITPLLTMGGASWPLGMFVENTHAGCSRATFAAVICFSGLCPQPLYVRLIISQSPSSGFFRRSVVTGL